MEKKHYDKLKETTKSARDRTDVNPLTRAQLKRVPKNSSMSFGGANKEITILVIIKNCNKTDHCPPKGPITQLYY